MMLFKNTTDRRLSWRVGTGPGAWVDYAADPGEFAIIPEGYRPQAKREGFTPIDELPADERPDIPIAKQAVTTGKVQKKVFVEDAEDGEKLERAMPSRPLADVPRPTVPATVTRPTSPPPNARQTIDMSAAAQEGPMSLANIAPLPDLPAPRLDEPFEGAQAPAGASLPPPEPTPPSERETKPSTPSAKDKAKK